MTEQRFHYAKKQFGQNFLIDETIIEQIVSIIIAANSEQIVEIGPGLGALTKRLLSLVKELTVIEIDRDLIPQLERLGSGFNNLKIHQADILKFDLATLSKPNQTIQVVGNLPYNISTPVLFHLSQYGSVVSEMIFMLQKEVVERICAHVGSKAYGRLTIMLQYHYQPQYLFTVPPQAFKPVPKVDSAVVRLTPYKIKPIVAQDEKLLTRIVTQAFNARRKTLKNALKGFIDEKLLTVLEIDSQLRPEAITLQQYVSICNHLVNEKNLL